MRNILLLLFFSVQSLTFAQSLTVRFQTIDSGTAVLHYPRGQSLDTIRFNGGYFRYSADIAEPDLFKLWVVDYNLSYPFILALSNLETEIRFDDFQPASTLEEAFSNRPVFIKDPNNNQAYYEFQQLWFSFFSEIERLSATDSDSALEQRKALYHSFLDSCSSNVQATSNEPVSALIVNYLMNENLLPLETIQDFYNFLSPAVKSNFMGLEIGEAIGIEGRLQPGNPAPEFSLMAMDGKEYSIAQFKGKKVLLHFWSSTCAPCIKEAPELIQFEREHRNTIVIINISIDTDEVKWRKGMGRAGMMNMINICDLKGVWEGIAQKYDVRLVPTSYLLDAEGKILGKGVFHQMKMLVENP